jgi:hypothetical protein
MAAALAILSFGLTSVALAQSGVIVQLFQPPPNQLKIADFWRIRLVNNSQNTYRICLFGTLDETGIGKRLVDATTRVFILPPGTKVITGNDIQPIDAEYFDDRYKNAFLRTGQAPTGEYRICVEVRNECGTEVLATDCKSAVVQQLTPPILISPPNESTVEEPLPAFSWLPPAPLRAGQRVNYKLQIVEVLGRQTGYDAMQSNPAWFEHPPVNVTVFQYPISSRRFRPGARYAWRVVASEGDFPMGESEIWDFTFLPRKNVDLSDDDGDRDGGTERKGEGGLGGPITGFDFKQKPGSIVTFPDAKGRSRGIAILDYTGKVSLIDDRIRFNYEDLIGKLTPTIPPALLKELLRTCSGD